MQLTDHLGRRLVAPGARRLVSLVPSITETVFALGAGDRLVGRTDYCVHPATAASVRAVGGTKNPDVDAIVALAPDLVLANQEENREVSVRALEEKGVPVFVTDVRTVAKARAWVDELAAMLGSPLPGRCPLPGPPPLRGRGRGPGSGPRGVALVWRSPLVAVGKDTYASDLLASCGVENVFSSEEPGRYPRPSLEELAALRPELILLPTEPYAWTRDEGRELDEALRARGVRAQVIHVPGEALTWWGSRTDEAIGEIRRVLEAARAIPTRED